MTVKYIDSMSELLAGLHGRLAAGRKAAENHHVKMAELRHGDCFVRTSLEAVIYGEVIEHTDFPEDADDIAQARANGYVYGRCFSVLCPEGEFGDTHLTNVGRKISKEEFEAAKASGWTSLP